MAGPRLFGLDALRGFAALCVVLFHYTLRYPRFMAGLGMASTPLFAGFTQEDAGIVPVLWFFLISGFVIAWTVERSRTPADFIVSRFSRLYPAYWASMILTVGLGLLWPLPGVKLSTAQVLVNLTMLQEYVLVPNVAGVYWSLAVELLFYIYAAVLLAAGLWRHVHRVALAWIVLALAAFFAERAGMYVPWRVSQILLLRYAPFLAAGMMLYALWRGHHPLSSAITLGLCTLAIIISYHPLPAATCLAAMVIIAVSARGEAGWFAPSPLVWLGGISYALYLSHEHLGYFCMRMADLAGAPHWLGIASASVAAIGVACGITYAIERPALRWIRATWRMHVAEKAGVLF